MKRIRKTFSIENIEKFAKQSVLWSKQFREVVFLNSNMYQSAYHSIEKVMACDAMTLIQTDDFSQCKEYQSTLKDWCFGFISYEVKNQVFGLNTNKINDLDVDSLFFFQPKRIIFFQGNEVVFLYLSCCEDEINQDFQEILSINLSDEFCSESISLTPRVDLKKYKKQFEKAIQYIKKGDTYELNYCIEFFHRGSEINPYVFYNVLNNSTKSSFSAFVKKKDFFVMSASPERYLKKEANKIISQPIKGTAKRGKTKEEDLFFKTQLENSPKERTENIMIVDLVRNDLSTIAVKNSVEVEELCKIYTFPPVHQMISTVSCKVEFQTNPLDIIWHTFPMASMTGVPKKRTLEIIEELEEHQRGLYSGAIGYITPENDFDFNVVIRTLLYNNTSKYLSLSVGSAITFQANAEDEYQECLLKANAIRKILNNDDRKNTK